MEKGLIPRQPKTDESHDEEWAKLLDYRDGLVHARASRPQTAGQSGGQAPLPTLAELDGLPAGWAVDVAVEHVRRLHDAAGTALPAWLRERDNAMT